MLSVCMLLFLAACSTSSQENHLAMTESAVITEYSETHSTTTDAVQILTLEKSLYTYHEWAKKPPQPLGLSEHAYVTLGHEDAQTFPEMAEVLDQIATMQEKTMLEEFYNLVSSAYEKLDENPAGFKPYTSTLDIQMRRSDSLDDHSSDTQRIVFTVGSNGLPRS